MASWLAASVAATLLAVAPTSAPKPKLKHSTARGFVIGGVITTALTVWSGGITAASMLDSDDPAVRARGRWLAIPVYGPLAVAAGGDKRVRPIGSMSVYQGVGIALTSVGAVSLYRHRRIDREEGALRRANTSTGLILITQGMMWLSLSWGMTYGFSRQRAKKGDEFARRMQVPLVGGILAAPEAPSHTRGYLGLTSSGFQLLSAAAIVSGAVIVSRSRKPRNLTVLPMPSRDGAGVVAAMRF